MILFGLWFIFAIIVGVIGNDKSIGFFGAFILSLILSPLIGLIIVLVSKNKGDVTNFNYKCDKCGNLYESKVRLKLYKCSNCGHIEEFTWHLEENSNNIE